MHSDNEALVVSKIGGRLEVGTVAESKSGRCERRKYSRVSWYWRKEKHSQSAFNLSIKHSRDILSDTNPAPWRAFIPRVVLLKHITVQNCCLQTASRPVFLILETYILARALLWSDLLLHVFSSNDVFPDTKSTSKRSFGATFNS